ncbi:MAG: hypothetical protein ABT04_01025 [Granulicella sp. SCN 62-9]|nr:MAG: hypothetical protein ABT04_01025 [Granulicella sp. SCN 62-9]
MSISESKSGRNRPGRNRLLGSVIGIAIFAGMANIAGCHRQAFAGQTVNDTGPDPADANMAPVDGSQQPAAAPAQGQNTQNESLQRADEYKRTGAQAGAPPPDEQNAQQDQTSDQNYDPNQDGDQSYADNQGDQNYPDDQSYQDGVDAGQQAIEEATQPPPPLPVYTQPYAPGPNYIWTPGYWSYAPIGYYWVPGAWVAAPYYGALWPPGYWGFYNNRYRFYHGYWGLHIGFYGGVHYGFGYTGVGYHGGYWNGNNFYYNRTVNRINVTRITNVYSRTVVMNNYTRVAYNGGRGGIQSRPNRSELVAMRGPKTRPMSTQVQVQRQAQQNRQQFFNQNRGRPATAVVARPIRADKGIQRPVARPVTRPVQPNRQQPGLQTRPAQPGQVNQPGRVQTRPNYNQNQSRPTQPNREMPIRPNVNPAQPQNRPVPPQRQIQPQRSVQPQRQMQQQMQQQRQAQMQQQRQVQQQQQVRQQQQQRQIQQRQVQQQRQMQQRQVQQQRQIQPRPQAQSRPMARPQQQRAQMPRQQERSAPQREHGR